MGSASPADSSISVLKKRIRERMWRQLTEAGVIRPPLPVTGRIPNFTGATQAAIRLQKTPDFTRWHTIFCNPDSPQKPLRQILLTTGKRVIMATPRLRSGFLLLDPQRIPKKQLHWAASIRGAFALGEQVDQPPEPIDAKIAGCVAVDQLGGRLGKGGGYCDLEYGILRELGLATEKTPILATVHDLQVSVTALPMAPHDIPIDIIATPTREIHTKTRYSRPQGIDWKLISLQRRRQIKWPPTLQPPATL